MLDELNLLETLRFYENLATTPREYSYVDISGILGA